MFCCNMTSLEFSHQFQAHGTVAPVIEFKDISCSYGEFLQCRRRGVDFSGHEIYAERCPKSILKKNSRFALCWSLEWHMDCEPVPRCLGNDAEKQALP